MCDPMRVLRAAVVLGVSTPLVVLACGSDNPAIKEDGAAGEGGQGPGGASSGGTNNGGSSSGTSGTAAAGGELASGGATVGEGGAGGTGGPDLGGAAGQTSAGAGGEGGAVTEPEPECGDAAVDGGLVCFEEPAPLTLVEGTPADIAVGEWNGAEGLDVIVASNLGVSYFPNDGDGAFTADTYVTNTEAALVLAAAQLDTAANHLDLLVAHANSTGYSQIAFGNGEGQKTTQEYSYFGSEGALFNYFVADVDGSGESQDVVVTFQNSISVVATSGSEGEGYAGPSDSTWPTSPQDAVLAQLGSAQWLVYSSQASLGREQVTLDSNVLTLGTAVEPTPAGGTASQLDVGDFNEDGFDDVAATLSGSGNLSHLAGELFKLETKTQFTHVPYKGSGPVMVALLSGEVQSSFSSLVPSIPHVKAGRLRAIGVTTPKRSRALPEVPSIGETVPGYDVTHWYGIWGPKGIPKDIVARWNREVARLIKSDEITQWLEKEGLEPAGGPPEEFLERIRSDAAKWKRVVKEANIPKAS